MLNPEATWYLSTSVQYTMLMLIKKARPENSHSGTFIAFIVYFNVAYDNLYQKIVGKLKL